MLLVYQAPFVDLRYFSEGRGGRLARPEWPIARAGEFIRSLGAVVDRAQRAARGSPRTRLRRDKSERHYVDCTRRFRLEGAEIANPRFPLRLRPFFTRLISDGFFCTRLEFGFTVAGLAHVEDLDRALRKLLATVRTLPLKVTRFGSDSWAPTGETDIETSLAKVIPAILPSYISATTRHDWKAARTFSLASTQPLDHTVLLVGNPNVRIGWLRREAIPLSMTLPYDIAYWEEFDAAGPIGCWMIGNYKRSQDAAVRAARLHLLRLLAELQAVKDCLWNRLKGGPLSQLDAQDLHVFNNLVSRSLSRLADTSRSFLRPQGRFAGGSIGPLAAFAQQILAGRPDRLEAEDDVEAEVGHFFAAAGPSLYDEIELLSRLVPLGPTQAMLGNAVDIDRLLAQLPPSFQIGGDLVLKKTEEIMGDKYVGEKVGHMGPTHAQTVNYNQLWSENEQKFDFDALQKELAALRSAVLSAAQNSDQAVAAGAVAEAERAAAEKDGPGMLAALKKAGQWSLGIAEKIGVPVAIAALKVAVGA